MTQRSVVAPPNLPDEIQAKLIEGLQKSVSEGDGLAFLKRGNFELNSLWGPAFKTIVSGFRATFRRTATRFESSPRNDGASQFGIRPPMTVSCAPTCIDTGEALKVVFISSIQRIAGAI